MNRRTRARKPVARRLTTWLAARILEHVRLNELPPGAHITEQALADRFRVSRTPVRLALTHLARRRAVEHRPNRGFYLAASVSDSRAEVPPEMEEDRLYYGIAEDRLAGRLSERVTESELARKYGATRPRVHGVVSRMAQEGWLQRLPGHGWVFQPMLDSIQAYAEAYRFRAIIEPASLRVRGYRLPRDTIARLRVTQQEVLENDGRFSDAEIFRIGAEFHEALVAGSGNSLLLDAIRRVNALRRLLEYRAKRNRSELPRQYREHLRLLDLIEAGRLEPAARMMERHLAVALEKKSPLVK